MNAILTVSKEEYLLGIAEIDKSLATLQTADPIDEKVLVV